MAGGETDLSGAIVTSTQFGFQTCEDDGFFNDKDNEEL